MNVNLTTIHPYNGRYGKGFVRVVPSYYKGKPSTKFMTIQYWIEKWGVSGSLFIHNYRGIARITSCYDFDDFKTLKDLYERLITDYSESTNKTYKRYDAIVNPEWHHVSLATLANIDFDMLDEKRKLVFDINQILKDGIRNLYKCENHISFEVLERYVIRKCDELIRHNRLKAFWFSYIARQLDEVRRNTIYLYT